MTYKCITVSAYQLYRRHALQDFAECVSSYLDVLVQVQGSTKVCKPYMPNFAISDPIEVRVGDHIHTVVYGPYFSPGLNESQFPYADGAGNYFFQQNYRTHLVSNSRVMNQEEPFRPEYNSEKQDYFNYVSKTSQKRTSETLRVRFSNMCRGCDRQDQPAKFDELMEALKRNKVLAAGCGKPSLV